MKQKTSYYKFIGIIGALVLLTTHTLKASLNLNPQYKLIHINDSLSQLHFRLKASHLLYIRDNESTFKSNVRLAYTLSDNYNSKTLIDSATVYFSNKKDDKPYLIGKVNILLNKAPAYYIRIQTTDLNRNSTHISTHPINKQNLNSREHFIVTTSKKQLLFTSYIKKNQQVNIKHNQASDNKLYVQYFTPDQTLARPPHAPNNNTSDNNRSADSLFTLNLDSTNSTAFSPTRLGKYHFTTNPSSKEGYTLFCFNDYYPKLQTATELISPLRYITSQQEFKELQEKSDAKLALDKFWLKLNKNKDQARELIKRYYNRTEIANTHFSSHKEGWKTDRGMLYQIQGMPDKILRSEFVEEWIYITGNTFDQYRYLFELNTNNKFTDNDFVLKRANLYRMPWIIGVDLWRQGNPYNFKD